MLFANPYYIRTTQENARDCPHPTLHPVRRRKAIGDEILNSSGMHCLKEKRFPDRSSVWQASISQFILFILFCAQGRCLRSQGWHETIPRYQLASLRNRCANAEYRRSSYIYNVFILPLESHNFLHLSLQSFDFIVQPCSLLPRMRCPDFADLTPIDLQALI